MYSCASSSERRPFGWNSGEALAGDSASICSGSSKPNSASAAWLTLTKPAP
jgi:hypothetical protein